MLTYEQVEQIEQYIRELNALKADSKLQDKALYEAAYELENKIEASKIGYKHDIFCWDDATFYNCVDGGLIYHDKKVMSFIGIIISSLEGILKALPFYGELCEVRKDVNFGKNLTKDIDRSRFIREKVIKYSGRIDFGKVVQNYVEKADEFMSICTNVDSYCNGVIEKLELYIKELVLPATKSDSVSLRGKTPHVEIIQNNNQTVSQNINMTFEDCFKSLDDCETLSEDDLLKIKSQIEEIQSLLKDKKGKKKTIKEKIGNILKWTADKATDVMIAVLPTLITILQGL